MNNKGYTVERVIHDGPYNDIQNWAYHRLPEVLTPEPRPTHQQVVR